MHIYQSKLGAHLKAARAPGALEARSRISLLSNLHQSSEQVSQRKRRSAVSTTTVTLGD